jgi:hypothetical protein
MEYIIALIFIVFTILIYNFFKKDTNNNLSSNSKPINSDTIDTKSGSKLPLVNKINNSNENSNPILNYQDKFVDAKSIMINSFKEGKILNQPYITGDGKTMLFHDSKRIFLCNLNSFTEKNPKFLSKTIEQDVICDASYSSDKKYTLLILLNI